MWKLYTSVIFAAVLSMLLVGCMEAPGTTAPDTHQELGVMEPSTDEAVFSVDDEESMKLLSPEAREQISEALAAQDIPRGVTGVVNNPRFNGIRVDYCVVWAENCGTPAASIACKLYGYTKPITYGVLWDYGYTYVLASDRICSGTFCDAIEWVLCED